MSRVDFIVDGETREQVHQYEYDDVRISFDGGDSFIRADDWMHLVIEVDTEPPEDAELKTVDDV